MSVRRLAGGAAGLAAGIHVAPYALTLGAYAPAHLTALHARWPRLYGVGRPGHVALTFDDGPDAKGTMQILDALDARGWKATFFMLGEMARRNPDVAKEVARRGHEIALHGYAHNSFMRMTLPAALDDIKRSRDAVEEITGTAVIRFRPPFGTLSAAALAAARIHKLETTLWTAWGKDWEANTSAVQITSNVNGGVLDGGTVLLHDSDCTSSPNSWQRTVAAIPLLAELFGKNHLTVGPLADHY